MRRPAEVPERLTDREEIHQYAAEQGWWIRCESDRLVQYEHPFTTERIEVWFDTKGRIEPEYDVSNTTPSANGGDRACSDRAKHVRLVRLLMDTYAAASPVLAEESIERLNKVTRNYERQIEEFRRK